MKDYKVYFAHILKECDFIYRVTNGVEKSKFEKDEILIRAMERSLEIIGEAAKNIPEDVRAKFPLVDFKKAAGLRDVLSHRYFEVDLDIVWQVIQEKIPELRTQLRGFTELGEDR